MLVNPENLEINTNKREDEFFSFIETKFKLWGN